MNTMDYVATVLAMLAFAWVGYQIGTLKVWPGHAVKLPPVKREPKPGEVWVKRREPNESPWDMLPRVEIVRTLDGWVDAKTVGTYYQASVRGTIRSFVESFDPVDESKGNV